MLEVEHVSTGYGRLPVLFDVSLTVGAGEMVALLGPNGAGKSTLLKAILGMLRIRSGSLTFEGRRLTAAPAHERFAAGISLCPEGRRIFKNLTVKENLLAGSCSVSRQDASEQLDVCYNLFPILGQRQQQRAGSLSGGEQQMVALSRALMSRPRLLLVDGFGADRGQPVARVAAGAVRPRSRAHRGGAARRPHDRLCRPGCAAGEGSD